MLLEFTEHNFGSALSSHGLAVVDFWSPWCGPCNMLTPVIKRLAENNSDVMVGKLNTSENPSLTTQYSVNAIPTILFFKDGKVVKRLLGYQSEAQLQKCVDELK